MLLTIQIFYFKASKIGVMTKTATLKFHICMLRRAVFLLHSLNSRELIHIQANAGLWKVSWLILVVTTNQSEHCVLLLQFSLHFTNVDLWVTTYSFLL